MHTCTHAHTYTTHTQTQGSGKLLAPVDFDLAFSRQSFISPYSGAPDDELFDSWLASENTEMERALAGEQANTGVAMVQAGVRSHTMSGGVSIESSTLCPPFPTHTHTPTPTH